MTRAPCISFPSASFKGTWPAPSSAATSYDATASPLTWPPPSCAAMTAGSSQAASHSRSAAQSSQPSQRHPAHHLLLHRRLFFWHSYAAAGGRSSAFSSNRGATGDLQVSSPGQRQAQGGQGDICSMGARRHRSALVQPVEQPPTPRLIL